jgi:flagellar hook protein FlgE
VGTTTYSDNTADADLGADLHRNLLNGNYSYYVTYADAPGGPGVGTESRPSPISGPINVANGRIELSNFPAAAPGSEWQVMRIYRNTATDDSTFYYLGEVGDVTGSVTLTDSTSDAEIMGNARLDMNGPRIIPSTRLVQVLSRDGSAYEQVFQEGTLLFAGTKGGRTLDVREFEITSASTVLELINFMEEAMGIQDPGDDPVNPIPPDSGTGANPGGTVSSDGRIVFVGNNGVDNAIDIKTAGMQLATAAGTQNINLSFATAQEAVGDGAVTDFIVYDSLGIPLRVRLTMVLENRSSTSTTYRWFADSADNDPATGSKIAVGTGQVTFDGEGNFISATQDNVAIDRRNISSRSPLEFELDFSSLSGLAAEVSTLAVTRQDGSAPGVLSSFIVGEDGTIRGVFSNGVTRNLGQIRLSRFANPAGLEQRGENTYAEGVNSGLAIIGDPGQQGIGTIVAGAVEQSNTDTGGNLIDLILASTMYRSNTRVITTAQEMIDELLAMRR